MPGARLGYPRPVATLVVHLSSENDSAVLLMDPAVLVRRLGPRVRAAAGLRELDVADVAFWASEDYYGLMETADLTDEQDVQLYDRGWLLLDEAPKVERPLSVEYSQMKVTPRGDVWWEMLLKHSDDPPLESRGIPAAQFGA